MTEAAQSCINMETIEGVSVIANNKRYDLPRPYHHHHCRRKAIREAVDTITIQSEEFITNTKRYVSREEALKIAIRAGQLIDRNSHSTKLYSDSVW